MLNDTNRRLLLYSTVMLLSLEMIILWQNYHWFNITFLLLISLWWLSSNFESWPSDHRCFKGLKHHGFKGLQDFKLKLLKYLLDKIKESLNLVFVFLGNGFWFLCWFPTSTFTYIHRNGDLFFFFSFSYLFIPSKLYFLYKFGLARSAT